MFYLNDWKNLTTSNDFYSKKRLKASSVWYTRFFMLGNAFLKTFDWPLF
jgi:hypothetical protein